MTNALYAAATELFEYTCDLRRDFHRHPELGYQEHRTADVIVRKLEELDLQITTGVAKTGVVALMKGGHPGPTILLRADMDALPIQEETGLEYASETPGVMHACGHDGHIAVLLTVARILNDLKQDLRGSIKFMFQPAEEGGFGAERMIEEGILKDPSVDAALALHLWNDRPVGWVAIVPGPLMAGADFFSIRIEGKGGHGASPSQTIDPIVTAAHIVTAIQTIVSRNVSPLKSAVVSVTQLTAGNTFNVIPPEAEIHGTIRSFEVETRDLIIHRMEHLVKSITAGFNCKVDIELRQLTPAVHNNPKISAWVEEVAESAFPNARVENNYRAMVSDDMASVLLEAPGCYMMVGSGQSDPELSFGHHHPKFTIDENVLPRAAALMSATALNVLRHLGNRQE